MSNRLHKSDESMHDDSFQPQSNEENQFQEKSEKSKESSSNNKSSIKHALKIFKTQNNKCYKLQYDSEEEQDQNKQIISRCSHLQRAGAAMKYYDVLSADNQLKQSILGIRIFTDFCIDSYPHFLDDYTHIITKHGDDLIKIAEELRSHYGFDKKCMINECMKSRRHYDENRREKQRERKENEDDRGKQDFYCSYFDQLHHFIFHLYDIGVRVQIKDDDMIENKEDEENEVSCYDRIFAQKRDIVRSKRKDIGDDLDRYGEENNKYNM